MLWLRCLPLIMLLASSGLPPGATGAAERARPIRIGALSQSWGPTPDVVGLRDGLLELGYRENEDFVIGVRFTQGDLAALPAAARLVHKILQGADPVELPVEVNSNIEFVINLKVAKALGLTIPPEMLYRADRIVR